MTNISEVMIFIGTVCHRGFFLVTCRVNQIFFTLRENDSITRGHNLKIFKERCRLNIRKNSFVYRSTGVWNSLPQYVVDAPSVQSSEVKIDKLWKNHRIKNDFTAPPLIWTVSPLDAHSLKTMLKTELAQEAGMPNSSRKRTCKYTHRTFS